VNLEPTQPLTDDPLAGMRKRVAAYEGSDHYRYTVDGIEYDGHWVHDARRALAEVDRLRAENASLAASLDQFRSFPTEPGPGEWSTSYRMGYADAGRDVRALVRALDQSGEGPANG
jgi:hypothetical protein